MTSALASLTTTYLASALAQGYATSTLASRRLHLGQFTEWCDARGLLSADAITPAVLERYRSWLFHLHQADGSPLSWATQANKLTSVRMLLAWATRTKRLTVNPAAELELPRLPKRLPRAVLSISEMERVLAQPDLVTPLGLRDRAILEVLYSTGIRRMELVGLDCADLDAERGALLVREGKGKKDRLVPIGERAIQWTHRYLDQVRSRLLMRSSISPPSRALFLSARGQRIRPTKLTETLHRYILDAGIEKPGSVHIFRHTMATLMHDAGADIRDLQEMLGHAQLSTTEIYTHVSIERLKEVHTRTHPAHLTRAPLLLAAEVAKKEA
ncbi:MAG: xerC [Gemmatimonadetes bacterium]|nr:xerC [Gemmatimonadota bacterium]